MADSLGYFSFIAICVCIMRLIMLRHNKTISKRNWIIGLLFSTVVMIFSISYYITYESVQTIYAQNGDNKIDTAAKVIKTDQASPVKKDVPKKPDLEVIFNKMQSNNIIKSVSGEIRNNTDKTYKYVEIDINLYDKNGNQVGDTMDNVSNLEAGKIWLFSANVWEDNAVKYKIMQVEGY